jgi:ABC-type nickel/cobalt efflux system permease component RcnA
MRRSVIVLCMLALPLAFWLPWHDVGTDLVRAWLILQKNANGYVAAQMQALKEGSTLAPLIGGLGLAFLYGVVHAAGPGHGKLVIASFLASRDAGPWFGL